MTITLHFVRHAQGYHNLSPQFHSLRDPPLTPLGEQQCATLRSKLREVYQIDPTRIALIAASPLTRTLHTAALSFADTLTPLNKWTGKRMNILALPTAQETSNYPCDTGSDPEVLKISCAKAGLYVDLTRVPADWTDKGASSPYAPTNTKLAARARETRRILLEEGKRLQRGTDKDIEIVLVTHGGLLHYLTEDWENATIGLGTGWQNTELRSYVFVDEADTEKLHLRETETSRKIRGKQNPMIPAGTREQEELFRKSMDTWRGQGLQTGTSMENEEQVPHADILERTMSQVSQSELEMAMQSIKAAA